jgi:hypothetical protein
MRASYFRRILTGGTTGALILETAAALRGGPEALRRVLVASCLASRSAGVGGGRTASARLPADVPLTLTSPVLVFSTFTTGLGLFGFDGMAVSRMRKSKNRGVDFTHLHRQLNCHIRRRIMRTISRCRRSVVYDPSNLAYGLRRDRMMIAFPAALEAGKHMRAGLDMTESDRLRTHWCLCRTS